MNRKEFLKDIENDVVLREKLKEARSRLALREAIENKFGITPPVPPSPFNWLRFALIAIAVGVLIAFAIWLIYPPIPDPVRPPARTDVAEVINKHWSKSIERRVSMGATEVVDIESLYNDTNDPQAFDKIIAELEPKGNRCTQKETFYLAKSYAHKNQLDKVIERLKSFDFDRYESGADVQWFYALTLLKLERRTEAIPVLQAIERNAANPPALRKASADLLKDLSPQ